MSIYNLLFFFLFFFNDTATTEIYTLSLHDALPIYVERSHEMTRLCFLCVLCFLWPTRSVPSAMKNSPRSEEHTSELQSRRDLVCRLLLEKKKKVKAIMTLTTVLYLS